ncbi:MAG: hypothetical protein M3R27_05825 [Bacteroidota bacterium]|nr:hypothetical protein [Bacteroidota bacterium]
MQNELAALKTKTDAISKGRAEAIELELSRISQGAALSKDLALAETDALIIDLEKQINNIDKRIKKVDMAKLLGLTDEDFAKMKQSLGQLTTEFQNFSNELFSLLNKQLDAQDTQLNSELSIIEKRQSARDKAISDLESQLEKEKELEREGLANNVSNIKAELAEKEKARQADIEAERKLQQEKKKLAEEKKSMAKIQFAVDTALQASNLVTAISEVFATYAAVPYVAAALAALMVGSFAVSKIAAYKAINNTPAAGFQKGGYTGKGAEDEEAGVVHKEEFVTKAKHTRKFRTLLDGIHNEDNRQIEFGIRELIKNTGIVLSGDTPRILSESRSFVRRAEGFSPVLIDTSVMEDRLESMESMVSSIMKQGGEKVFKNQDGDLIIKTKSRTRIIHSK